MTKEAKEGNVARIIVDMKFIIHHRHNGMLFLKGFFISRCNYFKMVFTNLPSGGNHFMDSSHEPQVFYWAAILQCVVCKHYCVVL
jgi:hypothetical protein